MIYLVHDPKGQRQTLWLRLVDVLPECLAFIDRYESHHPLQCFAGRPCYVGNACMETLVPRLQALFDAHPKADLAYVCFKYRDKPGTLRAALLWNDYRQPRMVVMNPYAWERMQTLSVAHQWELPSGVAPGPSRLTVISPAAPQSEMVAHAGESRL